MIDSQQKLLRALHPACTHSVVILLPSSSKSQAMAEADVGGTSTAWLPAASRGHYPVSLSGEYRTSPPGPANPPALTGARRASESVAAAAAPPGTRSGDRGRTRT
eukprot:752049-Hanusia_phi.AAC.1